MATITTVVLDCADPAALAEFYRDLTDGEITYSDPDFVVLGGPVALAFQRVDDYRPQVWPGGAGGAHLDVQVDDVEQTTAKLLAQGASKPEFQPGDGKWVVLADPSGHVFCVTTGE
jgi:catechol 2,3-dioxygenase-like lactoylglutathione lyase family enzyme